jgi:beta-glucosidase/6-phospho-beta-glucosidase/beta-galactosidase
MPMTNINDLGREIQKQLKYYARDVAEKVEQAKEETSTQLKQDIVRDSPERRPSYKKGWRIKEVGNKHILHNATDYQLTHLLEHGHMLRNGERYQGKVHIRPNEEKAIREYLKKIERAIE